MLKRRLLEYLKVLVLGTIIVLTMFVAINKNLIISSIVSAQSTAKATITPTGAGEATIPCILGTDSKSTVSMLSGNSAPDTVYNLGYQYGWIVGYVNSVGEIGSSSSLIKDFRKSGINFIIGMGSGINADEDTGKQVGEQLYNLASSLKIHFWAIAGHQYPNTDKVKSISAADEGKFMSGILRKMQELAASNDGYDNRYVTVQYVHLISPILNAQVGIDKKSGNCNSDACFKTYLSKMNAKLGDAVAIGAYAREPEYVKHVLVYAQQNKKKWFWKRVF